MMLCHFYLRTPPPVPWLEPGGTITMGLSQSGVAPDLNRIQMSAIQAAKQQASLKAAALKNIIMISDLQNKIPSKSPKFCIITIFWIHKMKCWYSQTPRSFET